MSDKRFITVHKDGRLSGFKIIVDSKTSVNYLFTWDGYAGEMTVLLDKGGESVVTPLDVY
ncbi:DUF6440 family protein [Clostridium sp. Cult2]|uniref:DUF6440 family protein n=1 Tax=Clostridium sp. Cult2 TaxID=2079003 RepID=UPI001F1E86B0|nr:DUF6440 family protein [Clostridium sp. Cult2]MCF6464920.1 hypothetical protein [Clostridium sp. Cult2]